MAPRGACVITAAGSLKNALACLCLYCLFHAVAHATEGDYLSFATGDEVTIKTRRGEETRSFQVRLIESQ